MDKHDKMVLKLIFWCFIAMLSVTFVVTPVFAVSQAPQDSKLITALIEVESRGNDFATGDNHLSNKAYGCLQIRQPCVDDVNRVYGTKHKAEDCLGNRELSVWICEKYLQIYATEKRLARNPTDEDMARIWNGGPNGWKKSSTDAYWVKVKKALKKS